MLILRVVVVSLLAFWAEGLQKTAVVRLQDFQNEEITVTLENNNFTLHVYNDHFAWEPTNVICFR